jgi:hypothetical protein
MTNRSGRARFEGRDVSTCPVPGGGGGSWSHVCKFLGTVAILPTSAVLGALGGIVLYKVTFGGCTSSPGSVLKPLAVHTSVEQPAAIDRPHFVVCEIPRHCALHEDTVVHLPGCDYVCIGYLNRTSGVDQEVAYGGEPLTYSVG